MHGICRIRSRILDREEVKPATGTPVSSTATAKDGWAFKHWTKDGEIVSWDRNLSKEVIDANSKDANDLYVESGYVAGFTSSPSGLTLPCSASSGL